MGWFRVEHDLVTVVDGADDHLALVGSKAGRQWFIKLLGTEPETFVLTAGRRPVVVNRAAAAFNTMCARRVGRFVEFLDLHHMTAIGTGAAIIAGQCFGGETRGGVGHCMGKRQGVWQDWYP